MPKTTFWAFYHGAYHQEHQMWANRALHIIGTLAGLALLVACVTIIPIWWALAFPAVHAVPGLIGHRLFERNRELGDVRVLRSDYPNIWFIAANHIMTWDALLSVVGWKRRR
jgi:hypothetical protein